MVDFDAVLQEVNERCGLAFQVHPMTTDSKTFFAAQFSGDLFPYGSALISFPHSFPGSLPIINMGNRFQQRLHVESNGSICLMHSSSLLIDVSKPAQLVIDCLEKARWVLGLTPGTPEYEKELKREFLSYWGVDEKSTTYYSELPISDISSVEVVPLFSYGDNRLLCRSKEGAVRFSRKTYGSPAYEETKQIAKVVSLKENAATPSPFHQYTWSELLIYIKNNSAPETYHSFLGAVSTPVKRHSLLVFLILPDNVGDIFFGFEARFYNRHYMPIKASRTRFISQLDVNRSDYDYLLARGGAMPSLKEKRVLLLGCGSVGGFLANNLCQMGVTQLDMLDKDRFSKDNVYRHFLGFDAIRQVSSSKADLLCNVLNDKYPDTDIDSMNYENRTVEKVILENPQKLAQYDLIISALGEPTLNLAISDLLIEQSIQTPFIVCFNEPYGIGGHIITTNINDDSCLRCLYSDVSEGSLCPFRASLVMPGQIFEKTLSGCSGTFVPYSALDSQQTAVYAVRKAIDVLTGTLKQNDLLTWRGDASLLESQGYHVSEFYRSATAPASFENPGCPTCQRRRSEP